MKLNQQEYTENLIMQRLPIYRAGIRVGFRVGFSSWIFELDLELDFRVGFSSWIFELGMLVKQDQNVEE